MNDLKKAHEALNQIAELTKKAHGLIEGTSPQVGENHMGNKELGCTIKALPNRLLFKAAETAFKVNPVNKPLLESSMGFAADLVAKPQFLTVLVTKYWGPLARTLTVSFLENTPSDLRKRIIGHMNAWANTASISFAETSGTGHIRISREPGGYWSYLGTDVLHIPENQPTMNLEGFTMNTRDSEFFRVVRHETGHTLGFVHEHMRKEIIQRIDPEKAYDYFFRTQGWDRQTVNEQVLKPLDEKSIMGTPPDQTSIMCYHLPGSITYDGQPILGGSDINATDYEFAGKIYPKHISAMPHASRLQLHAEWSESEDVSEAQIEELIKASLNRTKFEIAG